MAHRFGAREFWGGFVGMLGSLPQTVPVGILVFSPLGPGAAVVGTTAAILSAVIGSVVAVSSGGLRAQFSGPRVSSSILLASFVASAAASDAIAADGRADIGAAVILVAALTFLCGLAQLLIGRFRLARAVKLVPFPVLAGFNLGIALVIAAVFLPGVFGADGFRALGGALASGHWSAGAVASAVVTLAVTIAWPQARTGIPSLLVGTLAGVAVFAFAGPGVHAAVDIRMPSLPVSTVSADSLWRAWDYLSAPETAAVFTVYVVAVSLVASLETLLSLVAFDSLENTYSDADREMTAQGMANVAVAAACGFVSAGSVARTRVAWDAGARGSASVYIHAVFMALALFFDDALALLPGPVVAAIMLVIAWGMVDRWAAGRVWQALTGARGSARRDASLIVATAAVALAINPLFAVALGFILSLFFVLGDMSRPVIRARSSGLERRSRRMRPREQVLALAEIGGQIRIWELGGLIFFGTADTLRRDVEALIRGEGRILIIDARRVTDVDTSGLFTVRRALSRLASSGWSVVLCAPDGSPGAQLRGAADKGVLWLADQDHALEWAEDHLLGRAADPDDDGIPFSEVTQDLTADLTETERSVLFGIAERRAFEPGEILFRTGDPGDALYALAGGRVRIEVPSPSGPVRIATFMPAVVFGEMAILDGRPRSASAVAEVAGHAYVLEAARLEALFQREPALAAKVMRNLARTLAQRLRDTNKNFVSQE